MRATPGHPPPRAVRRVGVGAVVGLDIGLVETGLLEDGGTVLDVQLHGGTRGTRAAHHPAPAALMAGRGLRRFVAAYIGRGSCGEGRCVLLCRILGMTGIHIGHNAPWCCAAIAPPLRLRQVSHHALTAAAHLLRPSKQPKSPS